MLAIPEKDETEQIWLFVTGGLCGLVLAVTVFFTIFADKLPFFAQPVAWQFRLWFFTIGASFAGLFVLSGLPLYGNHLKRRYRRGKFTRASLDERLRKIQRTTVITRVIVLVLAISFVYISIDSFLSLPPP